MFSKNCWKLPVVAAALALASAFVPTATAQCGVTTKLVKPAAFYLGGAHAQLREAAFFADEDRKDAPSIVGMWHVIFTAKTMDGAEIPNTPIDNALVVWHSDKTEIMNSARPPQDGDFCLGVWEQTGERTYTLNHFAWMANNYAPGTPAGVIGEPIAGVHFKEYVTVSPDGKHYSGRFSLDQYDTSGHIMISFTGEVSGTRITTNTSMGDLL